MKYLILLAFVCLAMAEDCPPMEAMNEWTSDCIWYPLANMRKRMVEHCGLPPPPGGFVNTTMIPFPAGESMPTSPCGNCGFKMRCQKRAPPPKEGCFLVNAEKKVCEETDGTGFGAVCDLPKTVRGDCYWAQYLAGLKQCINANPSLPMWRRQGYQDLLKILPSGHCVEKDGRCKCCCDPYWPNEEGTACVKKEPDHCPAWGNYNEWSQCLWYPEQDLIKGIKDHCQLTTTGPAKIPFPEADPAVTVPEKCGYCSFKIRCMKRDEHEGCFHVKADKKNCGPDDCPTCGNPCAMDKIDGGCDWQAHLSNRVKNAIVQIGKVAEATGKKIPRWKKEGYMRMLSLMPFGRCIEKDGKCHCCCHPYEPKQDESGNITCQVKSTCQGPWMRAPPS